MTVKSYFQRQLQMAMDELSSSTPSKEEIHNAFNACDHTICMSRIAYQWRKENE